MTLTIGNSLIAGFTRRLDVLPGDLNDDGVVDRQDLLGIRDAILFGPLTNLFGDINGDGVIDLNDYVGVRRRFGSRL